MAAEGIYFLKADNDRLQGKMQVHQRFMMEKEFDDDGRTVISETPRCRIFNSCEHFWRTIPELREAGVSVSTRSKSQKAEDIDTDSEDHIYDEFRYACMHRPITPRIKKRKIPVGSFQYERSKLIQAKKKREGQLVL